MTNSNYLNYLQSVPKNFRVLKFLRPPIYEIELSNNQLNATAYYKNDSTKSHQCSANFSNRRKVIADFFKVVDALTDLLVKFPKHLFGMNGFAIINVKQPLIDGLTMVEVKVIREAIHVASLQAKRRLISTTVSHQGQVVSQ